MVAPYIAHSKATGQTDATARRSRWTKWKRPCIGHKPMAFVTRDDVGGLRDVLDAVILACNGDGKRNHFVASGRTAMTGARAHVVVPRGVFEQAPRSPNALRCEERRHDDVADRVVIKLRVMEPRGLRASVVSSIAAASAGVAQRRATIRRPTEEARHRTARQHDPTIGTLNRARVALSPRGTGLRSRARPSAGSLPPCRTRLTG